MDKCTKQIEWENISYSRQSRYKESQAELNEILLTDKETDAN